MLGEPAPDLEGVLTVAWRAVAMAVALIAPGYVWARALFGPRAFRGVDRLVIALGLSLMAFVLGGLLLDSTPWGLQRATWAAWLLVVVVGGALVEHGRQPLPRPAAQRHRGTVAPRRAALLQVAAAVGLAGAALAVAYVGARTQPYEGFTQAWVLPVTGSSARAVVVGLTSAEAVSERYRVEAVWNGTLQQRFEGIVLAPSETWTIRLDLSGGPTPGSLDVLVYRGSETTPYRRATFALGEGTQVVP